MSNTAVPFSPTGRTINKVLHARFLRGVSQVLALLNLSLRSYAPEILDSRDDMGVQCDSKGAVENDTK